MMKRLICTALALSLMGATAASARSWNRGHYNSAPNHYSTSYHGWQGNRHHSSSDGVGIALGIGLALFGIAAIASASDNSRDHYDRYGYRAPPPPPPPPAYYGGYAPYGY